MSQRYHLEVPSARTQSLGGQAFRTVRPSWHDVQRDRVRLSVLLRPDADPSDRGTR